MAVTEKISITLPIVELRHAKVLATRFGLSLSGFITDAVRARIEAQARKEAAVALVQSFDPGDLPTEADTKALLARWSKGPPKRRTRKPARTRRSR